MKCFDILVVQAFISKQASFFSIRCILDDILENSDAGKKIFDEMKFEKLMEDEIGHSYADPSVANQKNSKKTFSYKDMETEYDFAPWLDPLQPSPDTISVKEPVDPPVFPDE